MGVERRGPDGGRRTSSDHNSATGSPGKELQERRDTPGQDKTGPDWTGPDRKGKERKGNQEHEKDGGN